jgi:transposase
MARAYEDDLRRKFFAAYDRGDGSLRVLALRFGVSHGWAQKIQRQRRQTGQVERRRYRPGPRSRMSEEVAGWMRAQVARQPSITLAQLQQKLRERGVRFSIGRLWQLLRVLGLRLKKSRSTPRNGTGKKTSGGEQRSLSVSPRSRRRS